MNIMAVIQKFMDQAISTNTSYNPTFFENREVPATVLVGDLLRAYSLGIKTLYYQNTYDGKGDEDIEVNDLHAEPSTIGGLVDKTVQDLLESDEECETCSI